ncbi:MAG: sigma-70 family RNA polymerase sigma factor [Halioglobus sp.]|nr:sigma-70 family RNA polymerase sigma factor [Halioglobus sp.]
MLAYQGGDAGAFECLYHRHKDGLFAFIYRSCPRRAAVEDIAQEAWAAVIDSAGTYQPNARFRTWLYQIGRYKVADYYRRRDEQQGNLDDVPEPEATDTMPAFNELERHVMTCIGGLPREQRDAVLLKEQGFSIAEIADITAVGPETVKSRLRYARAQLREQLDAGGRDVA